MSISEDKLGGFYSYNHYYFSIEESALEYDTLLVIPEFKLIVNIEVKRGTNISLLKKASDQTRKHLLFFTKVFGSLLSSDWRFVMGACVPNLEIEKKSKIPCSSCKPFYITDEDVVNMEPWIDKLINEKVLFDEENYQSGYDNLLLGLIGFSSIRNIPQLHQLILDPHQFSKDTEKKLIASNPGISGETESNRDDLEKAITGQQKQFDYLCYMLTPEQLAGVKCTSAFIIIDGDYGTGKTYVLKERAKQCADKNPDAKIAYINLSAQSLYRKRKSQIFSTECVMDIIAITEFENFDNIDVVTCRLLDQQMNLKKQSETETMFDIYRILENYFQSCKYDHVFIDELPAQNSWSQVDLTQLFQPFISICVTIKCDDEVFDNTNFINAMKDQCNATRIFLPQNMRNTENIFRLCNFIDVASSTRKSGLIPGKNVIGPQCYHYSNPHDLDNHLLVEAIEKKYFKGKPDETLVVLIDNSKAMKEYAGFTMKSFQKHFNTDRKVVFFHKNLVNNENKRNEVKEFLDNPEGILVTDLDSFGGAQARNTIIFLDSDSGFHNFFVRNLILRTMSFTILINSKGYMKDMNQQQQGIVEDKDLHDYVHMCREPMNLYHYENAHNIAYEHVAKAVVDTYFQGRSEENIVMFTTNYWIHEEKLQQILDNKWTICTINFDKEHLKIEGNEQKIENDIACALNRSNLILIMNIVNKSLRKDIFPPSLDDAKNVVVFSDSEGTFVNDCRIFIERARPQFSLIVGNKNVDKIRPFLNLTEVNDVEEKIDQDLFGKPQCHHYKNNFQIEQKHVTKALFDKYFYNKLEQNIVVLTYESKQNKIEEKLQLSHEDRRDIYTIDIEDESILEKLSEIRAALDEKKSIFIINIMEQNLDSDFVPILSSFLDSMDNIVVFTDHAYSLVCTLYVSDCINLILRVRPQFAIVVGDDLHHIDKISPYFNIIQVNDLENYLEQQFITKQTCYHYINKNNLEETLVVKAIIHKYFHDIPDEKIVILTFAPDELQQTKMAEELKEFYKNQREIHTISLKLEPSKETMPQGEINDALSLMRPGTILLVNFSKKNFLSCVVKNPLNRKIDKSYKNYVPRCKHIFPSVFDETDNIVMFTNDEHDKYDENNVNICSNLFLRAMPKFAMMVGNDEYNLVSSVTNMIVVDDLDSYVDPEALKKV